MGEGGITGGILVGSVRARELMSCPSRDACYRRRLLCDCPGGGGGGGGRRGGVVQPRTGVRARARARARAGRGTFVCVPELVLHAPVADADRNVRPQFHGPAHAGGPHVRAGVATDCARAARRGAAVQRRVGGRRRHDAAGTAAICIRVASANAGRATARPALACGPADRRRSCSGERATSAATTAVRPARPDRRYRGVPWPPRVLIRRPARPRSRRAWRIPPPPLQQGAASLLRLRMSTTLSFSATTSSRSPAARRHADERDAGAVAHAGLAAAGALGFVGGILAGCATAARRRCLEHDCAGSCRRADRRWR